MPQVESAGAVYLTPMELGIDRPGHVGRSPRGNRDRRHTGQRRTRSSTTRPPRRAYSTAMRIPLLGGRLFKRGRSRERAAGRESSARAPRTAFFPGQDPIGKRIKAASFNANQRVAKAWRTIVGVVGSVRYKGLHEVPLDMYDPPAQSTVGTVTSVVVRLKAGDERKALAVAAAIQTQARQRDPQRARSGIRMLDEVVNKEIAPWRFSAWVFAMFAALAFALSMLGLFSVVSLDVAQPPP